MSIDISLAIAMSLFIIIMMMISLSNITRSDYVELGNYKVGESALYTLKHDGTLDLIVSELDESNSEGAQGNASLALAEYNLVQHAQLTVLTYDNGMNPIHNFKSKTGAIKEKAYAISIPFYTNSTTSKYGLATLVVGK